MSEPLIRFKNVWKYFSTKEPAVRDLSLDIHRGEIVVILGTSGCGKTTTMKMINRLIDPSQGTIYIDHQDIMTIDPIDLRRKIGYAIQHIGLFPHMTVKENIAIVPKLLSWEKEKIDQRVDLLLRLTGLDPEQFRDRYPAMLSGGQRQRVGVARALAADPPIVLMDEPFGALDPITREQIQKEFIHLESEIKKTVVFVTHDIFEAITLADRIALMNEGRLVQLATPKELVENPANEFVYQFLGQHRFQLSMLTQTVGSLSIKPSPDVSQQFSPKLSLHAKHSFIDALNVFRQSKQASLPVNLGDEKYGLLEKRRLLNHIEAQLLEEKNYE